MAFELEDAAVVGADALEHAVAVEEAVVEDADRRFGGGPEGPAHVHEAVARVKAWRGLGGRTSRYTWTGWIRHSEPSCPRHPGQTQPIREWLVSGPRGRCEVAAADAAAVPPPRHPPRGRDRPRRRAGGHPPAAGARSCGVAQRQPATVVSAYRELEARGLVRGYVGRGTFVSAKPDTGSAPFAWRGKISAAALQATDTTVRDLVRAAADPSLDVARRRRAGARLLSDRRRFSGR